MPAKTKAQPKQLRGFALLPKEVRVEIARKGGASVPKEKRTYSQDRALAARAGRKGGKAMPPEKRSFFVSSELASTAGRAGGLRSGANKRKRSGA
jgi:general stress protein YciG